VIPFTKMTSKPQAFHQCRKYISLSLIKPSSHNIAQQSFLNNSSVSEETKELIIKQIDELKYADKRDDALMTLSQQREHFSELAPFIWHSVGTIAALLQEIVLVYPLLSPPLLD